MKQDDVIRLAKKAGFAHGISCFAAVEEDIIAFAKLVAEHERSLFAEECIDLVASYGGPVDLEAAIRARGQA